MMRPRKLAVLAAAVISVPLSWTGIANAAEVNVCEIVARPASFDHKSIMLQGRATAVKETTSRRGNDYTTFKLQGPNGCGAVDIFTWGHHTLTNGDHVRVDGVFETEHHQGHYTFYNEVQATKIMPVPQ
jgi:hypothetical protein